MVEYFNEKAEPVDCRMEKYLLEYKMHDNNDVLENFEDVSWFLKYFKCYYKNQQYDSQNVKIMTESFVTSTNKNSENLNQ